MLSHRELAKACWLEEKRYSLTVWQTRVSAAEWAECKILEIFVAGKIKRFRAQGFGKY